MKKSHKNPINNQKRTKNNKKPPTSNWTFSRIIHNKYIEPTSDFLGNTIARPNAILAGAITAFILTLITYTVAKTIGYSLSGSETIVAFVIGWTIAVIYDFIGALFKSK